MPSVTDSPRPVPSPAGLVVKNGSKIRREHGPACPDAGLLRPTATRWGPGVHPPPDPVVGGVAVGDRVRGVDQQVRHDLLKAGAIGIAEYRARQAAPR